MRKAGLTKTKTFIFCAITCMLAGGATAQAIHTNIDKNKILIGQPITLLLDIDLPSSEYTVNTTVPDSVPHFEVEKNTGELLKDKAGHFSWEQKIVFTSFDSGSFSFPPLAYRINHLNTVSQPLSTDSFHIDVNYMPVDAGGKPRDIKTILAVSYDDYMWLWISAGILLLLVIAFILYRLLRRKKPINLPQARADAYEEAMTRLAQLKKANEENTLTLKEYHTALADVLKNYFTNANRGNLMNSTSAEILEKLRVHELQAETGLHAADALKTGDAVKFAKYHATFTENEAALNYLKTVIDEIQSSASKKI